jgi:hypothetical protein
MHHRVAVHTVRTRRKRAEGYQLLGDIDNQGSSLMAILAGYLSDLEAVNADETRSLRSTDASAERDEVFVVLRHGQTGLAADIVDKVGELRLRQTPDDTQRVRCGSLFVLPAAEQTGWLAVHINNQRHIKGLLEKGTQERFRLDFPDMILEIKPYVMGSVLQKAVEQDRIDKVRLVTWEQPHDRALSATDKWVRQGTVAKVEMIITPRGRIERILSGLPLRFLRGDQQAFGEIVEFEGIRFDEAKLEVALEDGTRRTFNIEQPDAGHAFTEDLTGLQLEDGEPTDVSLRAALRGALSTVIG